MKSVQLGDQARVVLQWPSPAGSATPDSDGHQDAAALVVHQQFAGELTVVGRKANFEAAIFNPPAQGFDDLQIAIDFVPDRTGGYNDVESRVESAIDALLRV